MINAAHLRSRAESLGAALPPLLAEAQHLANTVLLGEHGRRRAGMGDEFWQYRPAMATDSARAIDWRRSAQSDQHFVREKEWQAVQTVVLWVDQSQSMGFTSAKGLPAKSARANLLAMALAVLLNRGGERVGLSTPAAPPRIGKGQLLRMAEALSDLGDHDYGAPDMEMIQPRARALFVSDFFGDISAIRTSVTKAADRGIRGVLLQVLDPEEEAFPFHGRTIFESMGGSLSHETLKANELRARYLDRLARRKGALADLARTTGWRFATQHTDTSAKAGLLWLYRAMERRV